MTKAFEYLTQTKPWRFYNTFDVKANVKFWILNFGYKSEKLNQNLEILYRRKKTKSKPIQSNSMPTQRESKSESIIIPENTWDEIYVLSR